MVARMNKTRLPAYIALSTAAIICSASPANAASINLFSFALNVDGTTYCPLGCANTVSDLSGVPGVNDSGFDYTSGLGNISVSITGTGTHSMVSFFDHDIDETMNGFFNETGATSGAAAAGQSWEIDEPGFFGGDIFNNMLASSLDNGIFVSPATPPEDVSMAMGWDFSLADGELAIISMMLSEIEPASGFYLIHSDPQSNANLYFSSTLSIVDPSDVPEPGILALIAVGLIGFARKRGQSTFS